MLELLTLAPDLSLLHCRHRQNTCRTVNIIQNATLRTRKNNHEPLSENHDT